MRAVGLAVNNGSSRDVGIFLVDRQYVWNAFTYSRSLTRHFFKAPAEAQTAEQKW